MNAKPTARHWTTNDFGCSVLNAEYTQLQVQIHSPANRRVVELATIETPATGLPVTAVFCAAQESWRLPVVAALAHLPIVNRSVDYVIWRYLALEQKSRQWLLQDIERVLAPNGVLICCHLNPMFTACWQHTTILNLGYQSATAILPAARRAGLVLESSSYAGPGWWKYHALRISRLRKPMASKVRSELHNRGLAQRPATAMFADTAADS